ncbi:MAG: hypothetical protein MJ016_07050 [Victivallaceae bacterium]|nr:hypothetical protein [Victivallaceae bacterium]
MLKVNIVSRWRVVVGVLLIWLAVILAFVFVRKTLLPMWERMFPAEAPMPVSPAGSGGALDWK